MQKFRLNFKSRRSEAPETTTSSAPTEEDVEWELRPGGMLVQKRSGNSGDGETNLGIRVAYGDVRFQISANSQWTFGELKKALTAETGLQAAEQRVFFKGKERENREYLDRCGVKESSKLILLEDPVSRERKTVEMRRNAKIQAVNRLIDDVAMEVNTLAEQVSVIEKAIANGNKVAELQITTLTEMLMRQAVKLDCIPAEGDHAACANKVSQGKRVQKCVERLDVLKVSNPREKVASPLVVWQTFEAWELFD